MNVVKLAESSTISTWSSPSNDKYVAHMVVQLRFQTLQIQTSIFCCVQPSWRCLKKGSKTLREMHLMYTLDEGGNRIYTLKVHS